MKNQTPVRTESNTAHRAAVITPDWVHYGAGQLDPITASYLPVGLRPCTLLAGTWDRFTQHSTIVVDGASIAQHEEYAERIRHDGWGFSKVDAWTLYHREGRTVSVGLRDAMTSGVHFGVLFNADTDPGVVALQLDRYHQHTGTSWRGTAATTALSAIRLSWENAPEQPLWKCAKNGPGYMNGAGVLQWERELGVWERTWGWVHTFDTNNAYLSAAINAECAWSALENTGPQMFDKNLPGYWLLQLDTPTLETLADPMRPPLISPAQLLRGGQAWVTTPYAKLLQDLGDRIEVVDAWTGQWGPDRVSPGRPRKPGHAPACRVFRTWGEAIRDAVVAAAGQPVLTAIKATYKDMPGALQRDTMRIVRHDWAHTLIDLARANLYRRILAVHHVHNVWPVRVWTDSLSYADGLADIGHWRGPVGVRTGLGGFKHEATVTTDEWLADHQPKPARIPRQRRAA